jgi:hypothetical protein
MSSSPVIQVRVTDKCVVVIKFLRQVQPADWMDYAACILQLYHRYTKFVMVFDLRNLDDMPDLDIIRKKQRLLHALKPQTSRQVVGVVVLTPNPIFKDIVTALVRAEGQAAPFYACATPTEAAAVAARLRHVTRGRFDLLAPPPPGALKWGDISLSSQISFLVLNFMRIHQHFIRPHTAVIDPATV